MAHRTRDELEADLDHVLAAPSDGGEVKLLLRRPDVGERELLERAELDLAVGVVGDSWPERPTSRADDGSLNQGRQVTLMNARAAALVAGSAVHADWAEAGDQLYVDLDLSEANLPAGTRLAVGNALVEVTPVPHLGCGKFVRRFGVDAMKLVNSGVGRANRLRGLHVRVIEPGTVSVGDAVRKV